RHTRSKRDWSSDVCSSDLIMFCSFSEKPLILRLYGKGEVIRPGEPRWAELVRGFSTFLGQRHMILLNIDSAQTSCGYAVPLLERSEERRVGKACSARCVGG